VSKVNLAVKLGNQFDQGRLVEILRDIENAITGLQEERIQSKIRAYTAAPTTGDWAAGDFIRNSNPSELGSASSKYVLLGWTCVASGTPGTWVQSRALTGN